MLFRKKLNTYFLGIATLSSTLGLSIVYVDYKKSATQNMRERIIDVAATAAALTDTSLIKKVIEGGSENTVAFKKLTARLRKARDANRGENWYVSSIYVMTRLPNSNPSEVIFIADSEENDIARVHFGEVDEQQVYSRINEHLTELYSPDTLITDPWGTWMSGFAPIIDSDGRYVATIGADVSVHMIDEKLSQLILFGLWGLVGSTIIAFALARSASRKVTLSLATISDSVKKIAEGDLQTHIDLHSGDEFDDLANAINDMARGLREKDKMKKSFARYVSQHVLDHIISDSGAVKLEGERRKITILFTDIRQFTRLSEHMAPELIVSLLNEYFETMIDTIFKYSGTLDKFLGDGMMIEFGAPLEDASQELHAIQAAIEMQQKVKELRTRWRSEGKPEMFMGIGIHTGYAIVGLIGSEKRMEYTAIGDAVNVASRLEKATKELKEPILFTSTTCAAIRSIYACKSLGTLALPGRQEPVEVFTVSIESPLLERKSPS